MVILKQSFGPTTIAKLSDPKELKQVLEDPWLKSEIIIIKPNFVASVTGSYTHPNSLRVLLEALDSRIIVIEGHCVARSMMLTSPDKWDSAPPEEGMSITAKGKKVNWIWLMSAEGWRWQISHPSWEYFKEGGQWDRIRKEEKKFLDYLGFTDLFNEFGVEYINVTDEVWGGRTADLGEVKRIVESRFKPVFNEKLYGMVPKRLYDLRGSTLISYAKMQSYHSFTLKNLFGLIPDPLRPWWHGPKHSRIANSIIGINKVYRALFNVYGMCETLYDSPYIKPDGKYCDYSGLRFDVGEGRGIVSFGRDPVSLDAITCNLAGFDSTLFGDYIHKSNELGSCDDGFLRESKIRFGEWLSGLSK